MEYAEIHLTLLLGRKSYSESSAFDVIRYLSKYWSGMNQTSVVLVKAFDTTYWL